MFYNKKIVMNHLKISLIISVFSAVALLYFSGPVTAEKNALIIDTDASCITSSCHSDMATKKFVHVPASEGDGCIICHEALKAGSHLFKLTTKVETLCFQCHDDVVNKQYKHVPVENGECTMCHDPHQSDNPKQLVKPPTSELCFMCHDKDNFKGTTPHGPVTEGECLECHHPHTSDNPRQLLTIQPDLCFKCHNSRLKDYNGKTIPSIKGLFDLEGVNLHKPFAEGRCTTCHNPHPSDNHRLLKKRYPAEFYATYSDKAYALCFSCHDGIKKAMKEPRTLTETNFRNGNLNLHFRHVNRIKGRTCRTCHHHHGSKNPKLIRNRFSFGQSSLPITYTKTETGGTCFPTCHTPAKYDRYNPVTITMKTTPRIGNDATEEELRLSRERDMQKNKTRKEKTKPDKQDKPEGEKK